MREQKFFKPAARRTTSSFTHIVHTVEIVDGEEVVNPIFTPDGSPMIYHFIEEQDRKKAEQEKILQDLIGEQDRLLKKFPSIEEDQKCKCRVM